MDDVGACQAGRGRSGTRSLSRYGLPRILGRPAFTTVLSRPSQGSLALRPVRLLQPKSLHLSPRLQQGGLLTSLSKTIRHILRHLLIPVFSDLY